MGLNMTETEEFSAGLTSHALSPAAQQLFRSNGSNTRQAALTLPYPTFSKVQVVQHGQGVLDWLGSVGGNLGHLGASVFTLMELAIAFL